MIVPVATQDHQRFRVRDCVIVKHRVLTVISNPTSAHRLCVRRHSSTRRSCVKAERPLLELKLLHSTLLDWKGRCRACKHHVALCTTWSALSRPVRMSYELLTGDLARYF
jgi:hypothetical protein